MNSVARTSSVVRAFTLVEVLVGILILGLGLLGLGAIYPAVAIQQRDAGDAVEGQAVADAAEGFFKGNQWMNQRSTVPVVQGEDRQVQGWEASLVVGDGAKGRGWRSIEGIGATNFNPRMLVLDSATGDLTLDTPSVPAGFILPQTGSTEATLTVYDRLIPAVAPGGPTAFGNARFVWDAVARRINRDNAGRLSNQADNRTNIEKLQDDVQVAVFVRRLDPGIRNRAGATYVPVAQTAEGLAALDGVGSPTGGTPTGTPNYAPIRLMEIMPWDGAFPAGGTGIPANAMIRYVHLSNDTAAEMTAGMTDANIDAAIGQVGQKFALANGAVVTVMSVQQATVAGEQRSILRIDPEVPNWAFHVRPSGAVGIPALFTAQPPVAVRVFTLRDGGAN